MQKKFKLRCTSGCPWQDVEHELDSIFNIPEASLWRCNLAKDPKDTTFVPIKVYDDGEISLLSGSVMKEEQAFLDLYRYFGNVADINESDREYLPKSIYRYISIPHWGTVWVCGFVNDLYAVLAVDPKNAITPLSDYLLPLSDALMQGERCLRLNANPEVYATDILFASNGEATSFIRFGDGVEAWIRSYAYDRYIVLLFYQYGTVQLGDNKLLMGDVMESIRDDIIKEHGPLEEYPDIFDSVSFSFDLLNGESIYSFVLTTLSYPLDTIEDEEICVSLVVKPSGVSVLSELELLSPRALSWDDNLKMCVNYIKQHSPESLTMSCYNSQGMKTDWPGGIALLNNQR